MVKYEYDSVLFLKLEILILWKEAFKIENKKKYMFYFDFCKKLQKCLYKTNWLKIWFSSNKCCVAENQEENNVLILLIQHYLESETFFKELLSFSPF